MNAIEEFQKNLSPAENSLQIYINSDTWMEVSEMGHLTLAQAQNKMCYYIYFETAGHLLNLVLGRTDRMYISYKLDSQIDVDDRVNGVFRIVSFCSETAVRIKLQSQEMQKLQATARDVLETFFKISARE